MSERVESARREADRNYAFFLTQIDRLQATHPGQFVLIEGQCVRGSFDSCDMAYLEGKRRYPDKAFSVQEVADPILDLGVHSRV